METQNKLIANHLLRVKTITPIEALDLYGCFRLAARIYDLRKKGHRILMERVEENGKSFARYILLSSHVKTFLED